MAFTDRDLEILAINQAMLESVAKGDWATYAQVCSDDVSCFEAENEGHLVEGLPFHHFYFDLDADNSATRSPITVTMARPHLRWLNDNAVVISYTRLTQKINNRTPTTATCSETRVRQRLEHKWQQVHVHRS